MPFVTAFVRLKMQTSFVIMGAAVT